MGGHEGTPEAGAINALHTKRGRVVLTGGTDSTTTVANAWIVATDWRAAGGQNCGTKDAAAVRYCLRQRVANHALATKNRRTILNAVGSFFYMLPSVRSACAGKIRRPLANTV